MKGDVIECERCSKEIDIFEKKRITYIKVDDIKLH